MHPPTYEPAGWEPPLVAYAGIVTPFTVVAPPLPKSIKCVYVFSLEKPLDASFVT